MIDRSEWRDELAGRRRRVWDILQAHQCDAGLVYGGFGHAEPFRYLTNFVPVLGDAWAIVTGPVLLSCVLNFDWQLEEARQQSGLADWTGQFDPLPPIIEALKVVRPRRVGVIGRHRLPVAVEETLRLVMPGVSWLDLGAEVALLRRRKSDLEVRLLQAAARITDEAFDVIREELRPGLTEHEVAARLSYLMQRAGAELSFPPTVISGNEQPIMIRMPTNRRLQAGDTVMIDMGAVVQGYQADASRTYVLGRPSAIQAKVWAVVLAAYEAALAQVRPGVPCNESHRAAAAVIGDAGYRLIHRIGHGIGLATSFEWPSLISETEPLSPGVTICLEPGIYMPGAGNMKLEDDLVVTEDGYRLLTHSSRELALA